jgi:GH15 family glucan-1,4-alpha-glucosidase
VGRDGSIDWLCWPRFDSPSIFGALLDPDAGRWQIAPMGSFRTERHYINDTNVLQTRFHTGSGTLLLTDFMPVASEEEKRHLLLPEREILRIIECEQGEVELELCFEPRGAYGLRRLRVRRGKEMGIRAQTRAGLLCVRTDLQLEVAADGAKAWARMSAGQTAHASLTFAADGPAVLPPLGEWSRQALERTVRWWQHWISRARYDGPARDMVIRSALALRLMVYAPSGAIVAAPTTSLPERVGGGLNWDYRFCWLRDASLTVRALVGLGLLSEAHAFTSWLLHATRLTQPELRVLYDVYGNEPPGERTLDRLAGHFGSRPVRIGNLAREQLQLDVYGEVIDAVTHFLQAAGGTLDRETQGVLRGWGEYVCRNWNQPDEGIWEPRTGRAHHTHSRMLCWVALDRLLHLHEKDHVRWAPAAKFAENRELIRRQLETRAWNPALQSYVAELDGDRMDATLLLLSWYGFEAADSDRMRATYRRLREQLSAGDGLLYRYERLLEPEKAGDPISPGEGAFGICSFWAVEYLALGGGSVEEARRLFDRVCSYANDVGLFAEEIDARTGAALGNFPQAFTHVGLINAALSIAQRMEGETPMVRQVPARKQGPEGERVRV